MLAASVVLYARSLAAVLSQSPSVEVWLCALPSDMRRGFDGLMRMTEEHLERNALKGGLFVFVNRHRDRVRRASETPGSSIGLLAGLR